MRMSDNVIVHVNIFIRIHLMFKNESLYECKPYMVKKFVTLCKIKINEYAVPYVTYRYLK
jgi:hypothetical protein